MNKQYKPKSEKHQMRFLNYVMKKCNLKKDCTDIVKIFDTVSFEQLGIKKDAYVGLLKQIEELAIRVGMPNNFLVAIPVVKKCYESINESYSLQNFKDGFCASAYRLEGNEMGYKMWLDDAVKAGVFTKEDYENATTPEKISDLDYYYNF